MSWKFSEPKFEYEAEFNDWGWPWAGHRYFAYDLITNLKLQRVVELGTHYGTSLWSLAQAVKDNQLDTELNAIDTWKGEAHAGTYGEEVLEKVRKIRETFYAGVKINLLRKTFNEALSDFPDHSIDLLHIDGLHTYEAVKHDFDNWLPKVKENGIILFHDIVVSRDDFGVFRLWEELREKYATLEFRHSYGLGVLFVSKNHPMFSVKQELENHYSYLAEDKKNDMLKKLIKIVSENNLLNNLNQMDNLNNQVSGRLVSVVFVTYKAMGNHFAEVLPMVFKQKTSFLFEVIVIDSTSKDGTLEFVKKFPGVKIIEIPQSEFGHGKTRQYGVKIAKGDVIVFLTQDARPQDDFWLENIVKKLLSEEGIVAVSSRILPREDADPIRKYNVLSEWCSDNKDFDLEVADREKFQKLEGDALREHLKIHDVSSAYKRAFMEKFGFDDVSFGEDVMIAKKALENGYKIAFASKSVVIHSHTYEIKKTYQRCLVDGEFNRRYVKRATVTSPIKALSVTGKLFVYDLKCLAKDRNFSWLEKIKAIFFSPVIHFVEAWGQYRGNTK